MPPHKPIHRFNFPHPNNSTLPHNPLPPKPPLSPNTPLNHPHPPRPDRLPHHPPSHRSTLEINNSPTSTLLASHLTNLKQFTSIALRHSRPSTPHLLMHALLISHRLVSLPTLPPSITSPTHLLLVSLILSESHLSDTQTSTHLWSRVASIPPHTIATLKREALTHLAYNITVKEPEYAAWVRAVKKCFDNRPKDPPQTSQTYIHAMQGATIAAAQSTADMIKAVRRARALLVEGVGKRKAMEDREVVVKRVRTEHPPACCTLMMGPKAIAKCVNHPHPHPAVVKMRTGTRGEERMEGLVFG
ncbi:hypothetical protein BC829DRAFT_45648 [Chytridium lagenaria]|nr:hypothetical protein BC829DRAFT_45648 [Chytridium lagenaria]